MPRTIKICPECGNRTFHATAHVTQDWELDENGTFVKALNEAVETTHHPDDDDVWTCAACGFEAAGREFNHVVEAEWPAD